MADNTPDFPDDSTASTNKIVRQIDCQYTFGKERMTIILKFKGIASEVTTWTAKFREGYRVSLSDITAFSEATAIPTTNLEETGRVLQSTCSTTTGAANATITLAFPYSAKSSWNLGNPPEDTWIVTWEEKSTDYEFGLEVYAGEDDPNAGDFEAWKNEKNKNIENYKAFQYLPEGATEVVKLSDKPKTLALAKKYYAGIESVRRAYPEVIRTTRYFNYKSGDKDEVDATLLDKINETPNLYYKDTTPADIWDPIFSKDKFDWLKASFDVQTEPTEYDKVWNMTVTESWLGIDKTDRGEWDDDLYGANRWAFALAEKNANVDGNPAPGNGRVNNTTFQNQNNIKKLDLNNAYTAVDANAFKATPTRGLRSVSTGIPDLEKITMPAVSFIGDDAFNGAANLKSINLTNNITYLGERVFQGCTSMTEATIEPWIYDLPASTFEGCTSLDAPSGSPLKIGGLVKTIGASAFKDCTSLTSVSCENAITSVGDNAFENDAALTSFAVGMDSTGTIELGDEAFKGCSHLSTIDIPISTITVGTDTFANALASALKLRVPLSFLSNVPSGTTYDYAYPGYVTSIAANEFKDNTSITGVEIPESVTTVGDSAFQGCTALTSVALQNALIGNSMFRGCTGLTSFAVPETVTSVGDYAFAGDTGLTSISFPDALTELGDYVLDGCTGITSLTLPSALTSISEGMVQGMTGLTELDIPEGVASVGANAFKNCSALATFNFEECTAVPTLANVNAFEGTPTAKKIWIPYALASTWLSATNWSSSTNQINASLGYRYAYADGTTSIAANAWQNDTHLFEVTIPDSVTSIGDNAFNGTRISSITIGGNVTSIGNAAFRSNTAMTEATLNPGSTGVGAHTFNGNTALQTINIGGTTLTTIPNNFAKNCSALTTVNVTAPLTTIANGSDANNGAFINCTALTTIDFLPNTLVTIGNFAFKSCTSVNSVTIPSSVTTIGAQVFAGCSALLSLTIPSSVTSIGTIAFNYMGSAQNLPTVTMEGKTTTDVQGMTNYPWGLRSGSTIHCTDGDITVS